MGDSVRNRIRGDSTRRAPLSTRRVSTPAVIQPPNQSLPPRTRAGDALNFAIQTQLPAGTLVFLVLTAVINNAPVRIVLGSNAYNGSGAVLTDVNSVATFAIASSVTGAWAPGLYQWVAFSLDSSNNRNQFAIGKMRVTPDVDGTNAADPRSYNEKLLGQIKSLIAGKALDDVGMYKIGNRELTKVPIRDLMYWQAVTEAAVRRERRRRGEFVPTSTVGITFGGR